MKIPAKKVDLTPMGYDNYWLEVPRSIKEGFVYDMAMDQAAKKAKELENGHETTDADEALKSALENRETSIAFLDLVTAWNLDGDEDGAFAGQPLPLTKTMTAKDPKKLFEMKSAVVREVPMDVIKAISEAVVASTRVSDRVQGN